MPVTSPVTFVPSCHKSSVASPAGPRVQSFRRSLREDWRHRMPANANEARHAARELVADAQEALGVRTPSAVVFELLCGACTGLDEYTVYVTPTAAQAELTSPVVELAAYGVLVRFIGGELVVEGLVPDSWAALNTGLRKGDRITLKANPSYWGQPKPRIANVTYRFVPEGGTRLAGLLAGDYDLITNLLPEDAKRAPKFASQIGLEHPVVILNAKNGATAVTADPRVRQALNLAVDKAAIAKALFGGFARVDDAQFLSPSWTGYNQRLKPFGYNPTLAELRDHADDLTEGEGLTMMTDDDLSARLGEPAALATQATEEYRRARWTSRHPLLVFGLLPLPATLTSAALSMLICALVSSRRAAVFVGLLVLPFAFYLNAMSVVNFVNLTVLIDPIYTYGSPLLPSNEQIVIDAVRGLLNHVLVIAVTWGIVLFIVNRRELRG